MRKELSDKVKDLGMIFTELAIVLASIYMFASHNGKLDSPRTKEAAKYSKTSNPVKTVVGVEERWHDTFATPMFDGYNPQVFREINFSDGSNATLEYRTLAWQPFMHLKNGEEFDPHPGERYEVTSCNSIVRKIE